MIEKVAERIAVNSNVVHQAGEVPLLIRSSVKDTSIAELSFLRRSLLFAELAMIAYNDLTEAQAAAEIAGFDEVTFYDRDGAQAYRFRNRQDCVIACRGTEPNEWNDIKADANVGSVLAETVGRVHRGFKREVDDLWPMIETALMDNSRPLYFCGHSLGGAMATICAGRCFLSHISSNPAELFTYGSPRVGDKRYINYVTLDHYRFVNNNDIVTRVPPAFLGYRHNGAEVYFDHNGRIRKLGLVSKRRDKWRGFIRSLKRWKIDHFTDHSIHRYIEPLVEAVEKESESVESGGQAKPATAYADLDEH
ncbi:lipase family protein [Roseiconus lacunae]|uniref:Lipase family protein n=1 Tax=Roseiconus lacunae TaxID=2605694 RepID=A0ABT7PQM2_9BACT|nr:lipase family protein [Roseiconus lacunae]MCD0460135.1 lipase family protein [Roseiconus lacunae]MDM4018771.1 lipase family protein [Roseiconus lacunae]